MYEDRIEINSPGLAKGYFRRRIFIWEYFSVKKPHNCRGFYRLDIIEKFGTGIARINEEYIHSISKPGFDVSENSIRIVLPVTEIGKLDLSEDELLVYDLLKREQNFQEER